MYVVMLAAGHVRLVAVGNMLVEPVVVEEGDVVDGEDVGIVDGVTIAVGLEVELGLLVVVGDVVLLVSGQVAPGLQGSTEQQPLNPFWHT
jgi:hypothetical protein